MTQLQTVRYERHDQVALITLARPDALNAVDSQMRADLPVALRRAADDEQVRVVVLTGDGRAFSAGADLKEDLRQLDITRILIDEYKPSFDLIVNMPKVVISAVNGSAAGISLALALACDLCVMGQSAFLLCPFSTISLIPDGGNNFLLVRQLGYKRAFEAAIEAQRISADQALEWGLVNRVVADDLVLDNTLEWAGQLAERAPLALAYTKKIMRYAASASYEDTFDEEARLQKTCLQSDDFV
ncbi:MAG: enoyl-CoA hydratase/isomerase family protein, partial [Gammaproteobacteria bacterium]|nr:enoyl-CoA hydratase/isomerase family protein [Gammaproteobacteria bacterium]